MTRARHDPRTAVASLLCALALALVAPDAIRADDDRVRAVDAVDDLIRHFWDGPPVSGHVTPTWKGVADGPLPDARGALWERAMFYLVLDNLHQITGNATLAARLRADWVHVKRAYPAQKLEAVGQDSGTNWACDDAGWSALMFLAAHRATGDPDALARAQGIVNNAYARWHDERLGGGLWYSDVRPGQRRVKSLYQTAIVLAALRVHERTGDRSLLDRGRSCYDWMEGHLLRGDGLYWCDHDEAGPVGANRPRDVREAGSVTYLAGNMGMGVLHATLFRLTGDDMYRQRALRTARALRTGLLVNSRGVFVNDRDAWTNGVFAGDWARAVLGLPGCVPEDRRILQTTARAIASHARTPEGFYGGCWDGPADGDGSAWSRHGSTPRQIMTSASAVNMIVAAAVTAR